MAFSLAPRGLRVAAGLQESALDTLRSDVNRLQRQRGALDDDQGCL